MKKLLSFAVVVAFTAICGLSEPIVGDYKYKLVYNYEKLTLTLYDSGDRVLAEYPITSPARRPSYWPGNAWVSKVVINPGWRPTVGTREYYEKKEGRSLPDYLPPGNERNAMGNYKMYFDFDQPVGMPIRGHGNNRPDQISMRLSRGCVRTLNEDGVKFLSILSDRDLSEDFASGKTLTVKVAPTRVVFE
ncbi:MAG: hypothetical protein COT91_01800 [Candidatus Doudnabacteria bacterium CG10_big_fil_rev_8_21_14_0_10_41_10]|uniref:L,D-TPase catalytic domain-containing protein n=1 Tax=Candidatus Doudnabacteria bacterium CG10_big_fil_rev_8_21_14_0_10_41_10 TaxID=1974551 RepID=A0A2H0VE48_9BACT|nr:MAG: hypothetical protein COT91_01800 [Candidatus Doudnabacteria bacterium CG10_big_fil_rev_8_21_14_0_10_41_10]